MGVTCFFVELFSQFITHCFYLMLVAIMRGVIPKHCVVNKLECESCQWFRDHDVDVYYCELDKKEFPKHCPDYSEKEVERDL